MHELSMVQDMIKHITEEAIKNNLKKVTKVKLKLGDFSGYSPEHLSFAFNLASEGTIAQEAQLEIENIPGKELYIESIGGESED